MIEREAIQFISQGTTCRGWFYKSSQEACSPCVVMAHGFCGIKEMRLDAYAERFAGAGYHALVFDYRHFGESDGTPRQILNIKKQLQDWHEAIRHARSRSEVDPDKIIAWGTSFSGGHVFPIASEDTRIAAVISQVPHMDGFATAVASGLINNCRLGLAAVRDLLHGVFGKEPYYIPATGRPGELAAMTGKGEYDASRKLMPAGHEVNETVAARIFLTLGRYSPGKLSSRLAMPLLVQVAEKDRTTPPKPAVKAAKKAPMGECITYDAGHFDIYVGSDFEKVVTDQINFLRKHLS